MAKLGTIDITAIKLGSTDIIKAMLGTSEVYSAEEPQEDLQHTPFFFENLTNTPGTITYRQETDTIYLPNVVNIQTSTDKNTWNTWVNYTSIPSSATTFTITLPANGRVYFRAYCKYSNTYCGFNYIKSNLSYSTPTSYRPNFSTNSFLYCNVSHGVGGNIQSMFYGSSFTGDEIDIRAYTSSRSGSDGYYMTVIGLPRLHSDVASTDNLLLYSAKKLFIPENLTGSGLGMFMYLFFKCKNLTEINPDIKLNLTNTFSYSGMFAQCENLITEKPIEVVYGAYYNLNEAFTGCSKVDKLIINNTSTLMSSEQDFQYPYKEYWAFSGVSDTGKMVIKNQGYGFYIGGSYTYSLPDWEYEYISLLDIGQRNNTVNIIDIINSKPVYYTTDGSTPTQSSTQYTTPFTISGTTIVKATVQDIFGTYNNYVTEMECLGNYNNEMYIQKLTYEDDYLVNWYYKSFSKFTGTSVISSFEYSYDLVNWEQTSYSHAGTNNWRVSNVKTNILLPKGKRIYFRNATTASFSLYEHKDAVGGLITDNTLNPGLASNINESSNTGIVSMANIQINYVSNSNYSWCNAQANMVYGPTLNITSYLGSFFAYCPKLHYIKTLKSISMGSSNTKGWTKGLPATGTFVKPSGMSSTKNTSGNTSDPHYIPYDWTIVNI